MVLNKLFGWGRKKEVGLEIPLGHYSDNNKTVWQVEKWGESDRLYKEGLYKESIFAFFDYLYDEQQQNLQVEKGEDYTRFQLYQGSKIVRGELDSSMLRAEIALANMPEPNIAVMRRLLEMNFNLFYCRYSLKDKTIYVRFDSRLDTTTPNKLYYGLKELATKADKQDDLLLSEFSSLSAIDTDHVQALPDNEITVKLKFLRQWIISTLDNIESIDHEKFAGGISYLLLTLVFRIDYLIAPEGKLLSELEKIAGSYYGKDEKASVEKNLTMIAGFKRILEKTDQEIAVQLFRSKYSFAIVPPQNFKSIKDIIDTALQNMTWFRDNGYPEIANKVMEYGLAYCQYSFSLPRPLTELFKLFMQINYPEYFTALGYNTIYYNEERVRFEVEEIEDQLQDIITTWKPKYTGLQFSTKKLRFDSLVHFNQRYLEEITSLQFD